MTALSYLKSFQNSFIRRHLQTFVLTMSMAIHHEHFLTLDNINPNLKKMKSPVREPLVTRAVQLKKELKNVSIFKNFLFFNFSRIVL